MWSVWPTSLAMVTAAAAGPDLPTAVESEDVVGACVDRHEGAQRARERGDLVAARGDLDLCAQDTCPGLVRADCVRWLAEVVHAIPSVVIDLHVADGGVDPQIWLDDTELDLDDLSVPLQLNPGLHTFRGVADFEGEQVVDEIDLVVRATIKRQLVRLVLEPPAPEVPVTSSANGDVDPDVVRRARAQRTTGSIMLGAAIAAGAAAAGVGVTGLRQRADAQTECAPFCEDAEVDSIGTKLLVADILAGVSVASALVGVILVATGATAERRARRRRVAWGLGTLEVAF